MHGKYDNLFKTKTVMSYGIMLILPTDLKWKAQRDELTPWIGNEIIIVKQTVTCCCNGIVLEI